MPLKIGAAKDLPLGPDGTWDGQAAKNRVFEWAGWPDNPDPAKARRAFLCYDDEDTSLKGNYHLPFADIKNGRLTAMPSGIRAAKSRAPQLSGASEDLVSRMQAICDSYLAKMKESTIVNIEYRDCISWNDEGGIETESKLAAMSDQPGYDALLIPWWQLDPHGNFFVPGSAKKTVKERLKKQPVLFEHDTWLPIGKHENGEEREDGLYVSAAINEGVQQGAEVMSNLRFGVPLAVSVGFERVQQRQGTKDDDSKVDRSKSPRYLKDVPIEELTAITEFKFWEHSTVTFPGLGSAKPINIRSGSRRPGGHEDVTDVERIAALNAVLESVRMGSLDVEELRILEEIVAAKNQPSPSEDDTDELEARRIRALMEMELIGLDNVLSA